MLLLLGVFNNYQVRLADSLYGGKSAVQEIVIVGIDDKSLQEMGRWPWPRERFASIITALDQAAVIGVDIGFFEPSTSRSDAILAASVRRKPVVFVSEYTEFHDGVASGLLKPSSLLQVKTGYANVVADRDGVVRSLNLELGDEPAFSAALYEVYTGAEYPRNERFLIDFVGPPRSFTYYSASDLIRGRVSPGEFRDKIVLIGAVARDFHDDALVPTSEGMPMPGVEIHANALQTMFLNSEPRVIPVWVTILLIFAITLALSGIVQRFSLTVAGLLALAMLFIYIYIAILLFQQNWIPNIFFIPFTIVFGFIILVTVDLVNERLLRTKVSAAFGKYLSPTLVHQIMQKDIELGGERRELTILFSDIRGFTSISEKLTPEDLVDFLNSFFTRATKIIMDRQGLVDKFMGDAIMAFWNAPLPDRDHAQHAVLAALRMRAALDTVRREHGGKYPRLEIGIGINTGDAVVGNIGSMERLSYTAIGDSVNLASRLEALTKTYGVEIITSEFTKRELKGIVLRELDKVKVKGKREPVTIYEIVGMKADVGRDELSAIKRYEDALHLYYKGRFKDALKGFKRIDDAPSRLMVERCKEYSADRPKEWDGVHEMQQK